MKIVYHKCLALIGCNANKMMMCSIPLINIGKPRVLKKIKGIISNPMPEHWYDPRSIKIEDNDSDDVRKEKLFNQNILANKKPYFMRYIYPHENARYVNYIRNVDCKCRRQFLMPLEELLKLKNLNKKQKAFVEYYHKYFPFGMSDCTINKICWKIEGEMKDYISQFKNDKKPFDHSILKSGILYSKNDYMKIKILYENYLFKTKQFMKIINSDTTDRNDETLFKMSFKEDFVRMAYEICNNRYELCDIIIDLCYSSKNSKQFCWDVCGDVIIENLLKLNNNIIKLPCKDKNGDIKFGGEMFSLKKVEVVVD